MVGNRDLLDVSDDDLVMYRRSEVGFVWQATARNLVPYLSVADNIELPMALTGQLAKERRAWADEPGWAIARRARFAKISAGRTAMKANDDYLSGKVADFKERKKHARTLSPEELIEKQLNSNFRIMEQIRARVDAIVDDPETAAALKPYYPYGCKRPTFHDEYLPAFNQPHVTPVSYTHLTLPTILLV